MYIKMFLYALVILQSKLVTKLESKLESTFIITKVITGAENLQSWRY